VVASLLAGSSKNVSRVRDEIRERFAHQNGRITALAFEKDTRAAKEKLTGSLPALYFPQESFRLFPL
jgi:hypothetical protein